MTRLLPSIDLWTALGRPPSGERLERCRVSPRFRNGRFANTLPTVHDGMSASVAWEFFTGGSAFRTPSAPVPFVARTGAELARSPSDLRLTWFGHSTFLLELDGARLLVDPVWGERASPSERFGRRRFYPPPLALADLPPLDAVVLSHDHYDHLDFPTIRSLAGRVPRYVAPLGVGSHLEAWGVGAERITELDWWQETEVAGVGLTATPARHFSGRSGWDRDRTLWCGWAFAGAERSVIYSGDTAMTPELSEIGARLGPFDLSLVEIGAYAAAWADVHLGPEQAVDAHGMLCGGLLLPVHWGLFDLALHGWTEPAERVRVAAARAGVPVAWPRPGESVMLDAVPAEPWWPELPWRTAEEAPVVSSSSDGG